ncbi:DNA polymerase III subunit beta [candidate division KSB1 bacterium]|nr:DNA polymerase III subunit beta [candidate division KSB1 bacterium]
MHFIVNKAPFFNVLQRIIGVIPSKTTIPILSNILVTLGNNKLTLSGTDLEISISNEIDVQTVVEGALTIPGKLLLDIVRELPDIPIELSSDERNNVTIKTEQGVYRLVGATKDEYPNIITEDNYGELEINSKQLARMVNKTIFAVTTDELRTTLLGIYFQISENELRLVATDGHRLSKVINKKFQSSQEKGIIVPTKALHLLLKNFETAKDDQTIKMFLGENHLTFRWSGVSLYTKLIEGKFPKYESVIPFDNDKRLLVDKDALISTLKRVAIFSNSITHQIRFVITEKDMEVRSEDVEYGGEAVEKMNISFNGTPMEIGYNAYYLLDCLKNVDTKEVVLLLKNPKSAALIYPTEQIEGEDLQMLLMPIRLTDAD